MERSIYELLLFSPVLKAIVDDKIYPVGIPEGVPLPAVTYQHIAEPTDYNMETRSAAAQSLFQINCWAATYKAACELAEVVVDVLDNYRGTAADKTISTIELADAGDMPVLVPENESLSAYGRRLDFRIHYQRLV